MQKNLRWKIIVILLVTGLAVAAIVPPSKRIHLGLDLQGGIHMVLKVQTDDALRVETETSAEQFYEALKTAKVTVNPPKVLSITDFSIDGVPPAGDQQLRTLADQQLVDFDREPGNGSYTFRMRQNVQVQRRAEAVTQAIQTIDRRVNELGVSEPNVGPYGTAGDEIVVELPGISNTSRAKDIIGKTALLTLNLVEDGPATDQQTLLSKYQGKVPDDQELKVGTASRTDPTPSYYLVHKVPAVTGKDLRTARQTIDEMNLPAVGFTLNSEGVAKFSRVTSANVGRYLAIILDDRVVSAPRIEGPITQPEARITGRFTPQEADDLALVLRSGALPAKLDYLDQREVGPTLGKDSVRAGVIASLIGLGLVTLFMLFYYRLSGINAFVSIALNLLILLAFMSYLGAVMTLPGIAGFILTIGMGVDSNVLIFERIREELATKKGARQAIAAGFDRVFVTIVDTHISSMIAAAFLFQFGTGPIRGFATTLFFGLISNVFTAVFVSRTLFELILSRRTAAVGASAKVSI
jgi:preprotein translocase subunit SecD